MEGGAPQAEDIWNDPLRVGNIRQGDGDTYPGQEHQRDTDQGVSQDMMLGEGKGLKR